MLCGLCTLPVNHSTTKGKAQRTVITLVDDLDGATLDAATGDTIRFGLDGRNYEIDLSDDNAAVLRETLRPYVDAGRRSVTLDSRRRRQFTRSVR
ncbi:histone-like nucleoid-structuring protein Lsr2 [Plantibacter sp. YIM 135249]|uniref:histone-like nucleoid-structuring protein Lsr2 n=1 Tax=Plantibacter sp. YIM 135249 TaxID=3423918 RepID=UPI003D345174